MKKDTKNKILALVVIAAVLALIAVYSSYGEKQSSDGDSAALGGLSAVWQDKVESVNSWQDMPIDLRSKINREMKIAPQHVLAIQHVQFSTLSRGSTFVLGVINQFADVSQIFSSMTSVDSLAQAVLERVGAAVASKAGKAGELTVTVYDGGQIGYKLGGVVTKYGWKVAAITNAFALDVANWVLQKEMEYINKNTSKLFEFLSFYSESSLKRLDTYIAWYSMPESGKLQRKGVVLYYKSDYYKSWLKGKDITTVSDAIFKASR